MDEIKSIAQKIDKTFWKGDTTNTVYGIFLYNTAPWTNSNYVYQIVVRSYSIGYDYVADSYDQLGGIDMGGNIVYSANVGKLVDDKTIKFYSGRYDSWTRVEVPNIKHGDTFDINNVRVAEMQNSEYINKIYNKTYPYYSQFPGN
jgi:hypothetical protein